MVRDCVRGPIHLQFRTHFFNDFGFEICNGYHKTYGHKLKPIQNIHYTDVSLQQITIPEKITWPDKIVSL